MTTTNVKRIVVIGMLIALQIVLTRLVSIQLPTNRVGFGFLPLALTSILFGPLYGAIAAVIADIVGFFLFPPPVGAFFPGFALTAGLSGAIFGLFLYKKPRKLFNIAVATFCVSLLQLVLNTIWLYMITNVGILVMLPDRIITTLIMLPVQISMITFFCNVVVSRLNVQYD